MLKRPWLTAALWLTLPIALNLPLLWNPGGSKLLAFLVLVAIIAINALVLPAVNVASARRLYGTRLSAYCATEPLTVLACLSAVIVYMVFSALGMIYTFSSAIANSGMFAGAVLACTASFIQARTVEDKAFLAHAILFSLPVLVVANLVAFAAGLSGTAMVSEAIASGRANQTLGLLGITAVRVSFPLTYGINGFGAIAAVSLLVCTFLSLFSKGWVRWGAILLWPGSLAGLVMTDARGAMVYAILACALAVWAVKNPRRIKFLVAFIAIIPFVPSIGYRFFRLANDGTLFEFAIRSGVQGSKLGVGTGRGEIWESVLNHFTHWDVQHVIGYGVYGQTVSGISKQYSWVFNELGSSIASCHNAFLQYLVDGGYFGAGAWLAVLAAFSFQTHKVLMSANVSLGVKYFLTAFLGFILLQSQTEISGTIYTPEILLMLLSLIISAGFLVGPVRGRWFSFG